MDSLRFNYDPNAEGARVKMELRASFLINQVELVEATSRAKNIHFGRTEIEYEPQFYSTPSVVPFDNQSDDISSDGAVTFGMNQQSTFHPHSDEIFMDGPVRSGRNQQPAAPDVDVDVHFEQDLVTASSDDDDDQYNSGNESDDGVANMYVENHTSLGMNDRVDISMGIDHEFDPYSQSRNFSHGNHNHMSSGEVYRLREALRQCSDANLNIRSNADLKVMKLQLEVEHLRQQLATERATNSKLSVLNMHLRDRTMAILSQSNTASNAAIISDLRSMRHREKSVARHLNYFIASRNQAIQESSALKMLLLSTCLECRQRLPLKTLDSYVEGIPEKADESDMSVGDVETIVAVVARADSNDIPPLEPKSNHPLEGKSMHSVQSTFSGLNDTTSQRNREITIDFSNVAPLVENSTSRNRMYNNPSSKSHSIPDTTCREIPINFSDFGSQCYTQKHPYDIDASLQNIEEDTSTNASCAGESVINMQATNAYPTMAPSDSQSLVRHANGSRNKTFVHPADGDIALSTRSYHERTMSSEVLLDGPPPNQIKKFHSTHHRNFANIEMYGGQGRSNDSNSLEYQTQAHYGENESSQYGMVTSDTISATQDRMKECHFHMDHAANSPERNIIIASQSKKNKTDTAKWRRRFQAGVFGSENDTAS